MFARTTKFQLQPGQMSEFMRIMHELIVPTLQRQPGFRSITLLVNEANNHVLGMTQWTAQADLAAMEIGEVNRQLLEALHPCIAQPPVQESYAIALQVEPI